MKNVNDIGHSRNYLILNLFGMIILLLIYLISPNMVMVQELCNIIKSYSNSQPDLNFPMLNQISIFQFSIKSIFSTQLSSALRQ